MHPLLDQTLLYLSEKNEYQYYDENGSQCPGRGIAPTRAMRPIRKCADKHKDENNKDDCSEHWNAFRYIMCRDTLASLDAFSLSPVLNQARCGQ
jgi:hypothetical protein